MTIQIDYSPLKECKHPEWTYGEICVQCGECGRFDNPPFVSSDIKIITQRHEGIPPLWRYPKEEGGYFKSRDGMKKCECWYRNNELIKDKTTLEDIISQWWYPERLPYLRWWIEGKNY